MVSIEKFEFTYQDYLNYCVNFCYPITEEEYLCVEEGSEEYVYRDEKAEKTGDKKHDKIFKEILQDKGEMAKFINTFVGHKIESDELEIYNPNYITKNFEYKNADIVYKVKEDEIYFLIEHQTKVDYAMAYRILNYCVEIIKRAVTSLEINRASFRYPKVIPIVLYTGNQKWTASTSFSKIEIQYEDIEGKNIDAKYKLIDINEYEEEELLNEKTLLASVMILENCKNNEEAINVLRNIIKNLIDDEQKEKLKRIVMYLYNEINEKD